MFSHKWIKKQFSSSNPQINKSSFINQLIDSINFAEEFYAKKVLLVLGNSGSGKTKFINCLNEIEADAKKLEFTSSLFHPTENKQTDKTYLPILHNLNQINTLCCEIGGLEEKSNTSEKFLLLLNTLLTTMLPQQIAGIVITININTLFVDRATSFDLLLEQLSKFITQASHYDLALINEENEQASIVMFLDNLIRSSENSPTIVL